MSSTPDEAPDLEVIDRAIQGDVDAFGQLYDYYLTPIYNFILFQVSSVEEAEDLTEIVFLKAFENLPAFRSKKVMENFRAWIYRIARNLVIDHYRTKKPTVPLDPEFPIASNEPPLGAELQMQQEYESTMELIKSLDEPFQQVLIMRFVQELSYREIADVLDIKENYVRVLQFRGIKKIRSMIGL
jgi:RNA polymerase sigma-70 factor (ECF subfamily)